MRLTTGSAILAFCRRKRQAGLVELSQQKLKDLEGGRPDG